MTLHASDDLFSIAESRKARERALSRVASHSPNFMSAGLAIIGQMRGEYTGEDIRLHLESIGVVPNHHNAMGALIGEAAKRGLLTDTGRIRRMTGPRSNARRTPIWRAGA